MSTLTIESPPSLAVPVDELDGTFFVARTKPRQDKQLCRELSAKGVACYIPLLHRVRIVHRTKIEQFIPVIPGYVFVCGDVDARYEAQSTGRTCGALINVVDQRRLRRELVNLQRSLDHPAATIYAGITRGRRFRITEGTLMGTEGIVIGPTSNGCRFVLEVNMFGRGLEMEVSGDLLEAC